jgi:hypothetical protein
LLIQKKSGWTRNRTGDTIQAVCPAANPHEYYIAVLIDFDGRYDYFYDFLWQAYIKTQGESPRIGMLLFTARMVRAVSKAQRHPTGGRQHAFARNGKVPRFARAREA